MKGAVQMGRRVGGRGGRKDGVGDGVFGLHELDGGWMAGNSCVGRDRSVTIEIEATPAYYTSRSSTSRYTLHSMTIVHSFPQKPTTKIIRTSLEVSRASSLRRCSRQASEWE
jgi:hypothetical protein